MVTTEHNPEGLYDDAHLHVWLGGNFWDGRVPDLTEQGLPPPIYPNEMANTLSSRFGGYSPLLVQKHREPAVAGFVKAYMHNGVQVCRAPVFGGNGGVQPPIISWKLGLGRPGDSKAGGYFSDRDVGSLSTARMLLMSLAESFGGTTTFSSARTRRFQAGYGR